MEQQRQTPIISTDDLESLRKRLGVPLSDPEVLRLAVTHRSYLGETVGFESNERLEFLGDSVLGLVVADELFHRMDGRPEGEMAKAKSVAVSEPILADCARDYDFQSVMLVSTGEHISGGRDRASILSDMFEAVIAVIYLDQGLEVAREFILRSLSGVLDEVAEGGMLRDYKSQIQQLAQSRLKMTPRYSVVDERGADHDKTFTVQVELDGRVLGVGVGKSKKQAEQAAACKALQQMAAERGSERDDKTTQ